MIYMLLKTKAYHTDMLTRILIVQQGPIVLTNNNNYLALIATKSSKNIFGQFSKCDNGVPTLNVNLKVF